jgi:hypothetical protein
MEMEIERCTKILFACELLSGYLFKNSTLPLYKRDPIRLLGMGFFCVGRDADGYGYRVTVPGRELEELVKVILPGSGEGRVGEPQDYASQAQGMGGQGYGLDGYTAVQAAPAAFRIAAQENDGGSGVEKVRRKVRAVDVFMGLFVYLFEDIGLLYNRKVPGLGVTGAGGFPRGLQDGVKLFLGKIDAFIGADTAAVRDSGQYRIAHKNLHS